MAMDKKIRLISAQDTSASAPAPEPEPEKQSYDPEPDKTRVSPGFRLRPRTQKGEETAAAPAAEAPGTTVTTPPAAEPVPAAAEAEMNAPAPVAASTVAGIGAAPAVAPTLMPSAEAVNREVAHVTTTRRQGVKPSLRKTKAPEAQLSDRLAAGAPAEEKGTATTGGAARGTRAAVTGNLWAAVVVFLVAQGVSAIPSLRLGLKQGALPRVEIGVALGLTLLLALLISARRKPLSIVATVWVTVHVLVAGGLVALATLPAVPAALASVKERLPALGEAGGSLLLFAACLILLTGGKTSNWTLAVLFSVAGIALPWVPLAKLVSAQPRGAAGQSGSTGQANGSGTAAFVASATDRFAAAWPKDWKMLPAGTRPAGAGEVEQALRSPDGRLVMTVASEPVAVAASFAEFVSRCQAGVRSQNPNMGELELSIPGKTDRKLITFMPRKGGNKIEMLVAGGPRYRVALTFTGTADAFDGHRAEIDETVRTLEPY